MASIVVIGAGIGGLTTASLLCQAGHRVTVLEAQKELGGCAGSFSHRGYRWDAGATLAGGFGPGEPHQQLAEKLGLQWPIELVEGVAWALALPDGSLVPHWTDRGRWEETRRAFFPESERFWGRQERLATLAWDVASRPFPFPPESADDLFTLGRAIRPKTLAATPYLLHTVAQLLPRHASINLRLFVEATLLISAQSSATQANALYGCAAMELPRRGLSHVRGGMGGLAQTLADWLRQNGAEVRLRQRVTRIVVERGRAVGVAINEDHRKRSADFLSADFVVGNLTPWGLANLLGDATPPALRREVAQRPATGGAFMLYLGVDAAKLPPLVTDHYQVVVSADQPLGAGNSIFLSLSPADDPSRAPAGKRAVNISTHTDVASWWALRQDPARQTEYHERRDLWTERLLLAAERALPHFGQAVELCLPATPVTYQTWTDRPMGMVGGFPQTALWRARGCGTGVANIRLVGDSVFPGQSTAGVTLSGWRVAREVLRHFGRT